MNEEKFTINVNVAERYYPITIARSEEESFRNLAKQINDLLFQLSQRFPNREIQDYMAMALLQYAINLKRTKDSFDTTYVIKKIEQLDKFIEDFLVEEQVL
jgi:cell division protein ZapA